MMRFLPAGDAGVTWETESNVSSSRVFFHGNSKKTNNFWTHLQSTFFGFFLSSES